MRRGPRAAAAALAGAALLAAGCVGCGSAPASLQKPIVSRGVAARVPAGDPRALAVADTSFGLDVLGALCRADPRANIVLSPDSLAAGLGMAYLGARGGTARAMARVLHLPPAGQGLLADLHARSAALRAADGPGVTVRESDLVWADPSLPTRRSYLNDLATGYGAGLERVPLLNKPDQAIRQIDAAIASATRGHIPQLLAPGSLSGIGWVLTDALYLNANWATPFQASQTSRGSFTTAAGQRVSAHFLNGDGYSFTQDGGWTGVALPYRGGKLSMVALLPDSGARGCPALSAADLGTVTGGLALAGGGTGSSGSSGQADIALPKVSLSTKSSMSGLLSKLGMGIAFSQRADFTGLSRDACCIGLVMHAATLRVGEKGTVASAATAVGVQTATAPYKQPRIVTFDRPYVLLVTDTATGEPLFLARVANPAAS